MINLLAPPQAPAILGLSNPFSGFDDGVAAWFHTHLSPTFVNVLRLLTELGSGEWIGIALAGIILFLVWKRSWLAMATLIIAVPGGMLLNELVKAEVHRHRPIFAQPFEVWSGYSFASGHTIGAVLLYGQLALFVVPMLKSRHWRVLATFAVALLVSVVGFTRIALGAHYLSDVLGAIVLGILWLSFCLIVGKQIGARIAQSAVSTGELAPVPIRAADILVRPGS